MKWIKVTDTMLEVVPERYWDPEVKPALLKSKFYVMCQDNFTVIILRNHSHMVMGVAKRNPRDKYSAKVASDVAFVRAYRHFKEAYYSEAER